MTSQQLFTASRVLIVAGKGGVGKTTVAATLSLAAARQGKRVLLVDLEGKSALPHILGQTAIGYAPSAVEIADHEVLESGGSITTRLLTPDASLVDYLASHGLGRLSNRMAKAGVVDIVSTATPGLRDLLVLGKVKQIERSGEFDLVVVDAPAAGHAITFLRSPKGVSESVSSGALRNQANEVLELLGDESRCSVVLVTLPEETPILETIETAYLLEDEIGIKLGPIICNGWWDASDRVEQRSAEAAKQAGMSISNADARSLDRTAEFVRHRCDLQNALEGRLHEQLPLPIIRLPYMFSARFSFHEIQALASAVAATPEPGPTK